MEWASVALALHEGKAEARAIADGLAQALSLRPLGELWHEIDLERARSAGASLIGRSLAYGDVALTDALALQLWEPWLERVNPTAAFASFTGDLQESYSFNPVTDATFNLALVVVGTRHACLLWAEDED